jgi:hypothetical protein
MSRGRSCACPYSRGNHKGLPLLSSGVAGFGDAFESTSPSVVR